MSSPTPTTPTTGVRVFLPGGTVSYDYPDATKFGIDSERNLAVLTADDQPVAVFNFGHWQHIEVGSVTI